MNKVTSLAAVAGLGLRHDRGAIGMIVDVNLLEIDSGAIEVRLEPYAVAAPAGGEDDGLVCWYQVHSHDM